MTSSFIVYMFMLGLGTSLHCVSMCGPLVLTYAVKGTEEGPWYHKITPNLVYQGAKVVSYMLVGLLLGAVGSFFDLDALRPYVMYLAGAFMIVLGLGMTGKVPWAARLTPRPPKWLMNSIVKLRRKSAADAAAGESSLATPVFFGLMTGLLPCGPLMAAQVSAAASGSAATGMLGMAAFALGTAPLMIAFGTAGSLIPRVWKERMMTALAIGVMIFGLVFVNRGLMLTGAPVNFNTLKVALIGTGVSGTQTDYQTGADGVVEIPVTIENTRFVPETVQIPADKPVRLVVDRREEAPCSAQLAVPQLGVLANLQPNAITNVDLPPAKGGAYTLTCGMGMMSGQIVAGGGVASSGSPALWLVLATGAAGGALYVSRRRTRAGAAGRPRGASTGSRGSGTAKRHGQPSSGGAAGATSTSPTYLGLQPLELILTIAAIGVAILAGLAFGGMFN